MEAIETGAASEVVIARNGRPVARGQFTLPDSIDAADPHKAQAPLPLGSALRGPGAGGPARDRGCPEGKASFRHYAPVPATTSAPYPA